MDVHDRLEPLGILVGATSTSAAPTRIPSGSSLSWTSIRGTS